MSYLRYLKDYSQQPGTPCTVSFCSATYRNKDGKSSTLTINLTVEDGDAGGLLKLAEENGGVGMVCDDGVYRFLPWPPAVIEIQVA
jgi:hypothetical protein